MVVSLVDSVLMTSHCCHYRITRRSRCSRYQFIVGCRRHTYLEHCQTLTVNFDSTCCSTFFSSRRYLISSLSTNNFKTQTRFDNFHFIRYYFMYFPIPETEDKGVPKTGSFCGNQGYKCKFLGNREPAS